MKPVLLWPKPPSAISATLARSPDDFTVVDTDSRYELRRLSALRSDTPILDPFPGHGKHYLEFHSHIAKMSPQGLGCVKTVWWRHRRVAISLR